MKIDKQRFYKTIEYIIELRNTSLLDMDFSDLLGEDLTKEQKETYFWAYEKWDKIDVIIKIYEKHKI